MATRKLKFNNKIVDMMFMPVLDSKVVCFHATIGGSASDAFPFVGSPYEAVGTIIRLETEAGADGEVIVARVAWTTGHSSYIHLKDLFLFSEFIEKFSIGDSPAKFKPNDIVYVAYSNKHKADSYYPMVTTPYEIDCKIIEVVETPLKYSRTYKAITGNGTYVKFSEESLISVEQRDEIVNGNVIYTATENAEPLYKPGQLFNKIGEYLVCKDPDISIHISKIKNNNFVCTILDKQ